MRQILEALTAQPNVVRVSLQTNGVQLDCEWLDLFDAVMPDLSIGVSLDGDAEGNSWRVGYDAKPTYPLVVRALRLLAERGRKVGVITAVTPRVITRPEAVLDHLAGFDAVNAMSFVPCFDAMVTATTTSTGRRAPASRSLQRANINETSGPNWAITPREYAEFVLATAAHWIRAGHFKRVKLEPVVSTIRRLRGLSTSFCHFSNLKCDHVFTLYPDGRLGGCDELPWPAAQLTTLRDTTDERLVLAAQGRSELRERTRSLMAKCVSCSYRDTCGGGCLATRLRYVTAGNEDAYCDYRMRLVDGVAAILAQPADPRAISCRMLRWRPRNPNSMRDVTSFLNRWDDPRAERPEACLRTSAHGNINTVGEAGVHEADDLDPAHPAWHAAIESGVWPLVDAFTTVWACVTYDSCQGHEYLGLDLAPATRRVGIAPRDSGEYPAIAAALCRLACTAIRVLPPAVKIVIGRAELICQRTHRRIPVLDLSLEPSLGDGWQPYFTELDAATRVLVTALKTEGPQRGKACGCASPAQGPRNAEAAT
jgi:uncharacterized protein